jgi:hypothetical protein
MNLKSPRQPLKSIWIGLLMASSLAHGAIFGDGDQSNGIEDQRTKAPANLVKAVGTIFCDGGLRGTGTHIALNGKGEEQSAEQNLSIIVTAAHVLFDPNSGEPFQQCSYRPENNRLKSVPFGKVSAHTYQPLSQDKMRQSETDIVFVALVRNLYQQRLPLAIESAVEQPEAQLQLLGYNSDKESINLSTNCQSYSSKQFRSEYLLLHNCDARSGASGGPLLFETKNGLGTRIVGIHGGTLSSAALSSPPLSSDREKIAGAKVSPESWINQARKVDRKLLDQLQNFIAYLRKDSEGQIQPHGQSPEY